ncbi:MAG: NUDIX hydrolase [Betaproteobacteria bacterium RIFCSPLOWO2_12_FULL_62_58]|nr:MAG: NUDIX hydrolase [Betaproteobacteria bacterium RIFCSPLOWO2_12_FULL_62_58]
MNSHSGFDSLADLSKHIHVTCAIIERDGLVLATQRSATMSMPLKWEFPGGKVDAGEGLEECLCRELAEELSVHVRIGKSLLPTTYRYPSFTITLYPFICSIESGEPTLHEHAALNWLSPRALHTLDWAEADIQIVDAYRKELSKVAT